MADNKAPSAFLGKELQARDAADAIIAGGPLAHGRDGRFWHYEGGVWKPGKEKVHARVVDLLGNRYRTGHERDVLAVAQALVPQMDCEPVPQYINFRNGLLDWKTGELIDHDPQILSTVQMGCDWEPEAECPDFHGFLSTVLNEDDHGRFWEITGYLMMSGNPLHRAILLHGGGRNGKGATLRTWLALLGGKENVSSIPLHTLASNRFATAQLLGKIANIGGDIDSTYIAETGRIKEITGGDTVYAENKGENGFSFEVWAVPVFSANELPATGDASTGFSERFEVVPFPNYIGDRVDPTLEPRIQAPESLAGIAVAGVEALRVLMARRSFVSSVSARAAKEEMREESNPALIWFRTRAIEDPAAKVTGAHAYKDYLKWVEEEGRKPLNRSTFYKRLRSARPDLRVTRTGGQETFHGFELPARDLRVVWDSSTA